MADEIAVPPTARTPDCKLVTGLAELPSKTLLDERALAEIFHVSKRTVRRMVNRFELPPPVMLAGRSAWIVERVQAHIEARADRAARKAEAECRRIAMLSLASPTKMPIRNMQDSVTPLPNRETGSI